ncbi:MAG: AI-2E family transporter [Clostridiales bacterium]|nr:AI-2E family transporter [Clostridiales bacterium]
MEFNKKTMRKFMQLITFTVLLLVGLMNFNVIMDTIGWILKILMPFIIGGCIAFIICVPMKLFEEKVFRKGKSNNKILAKIRRPLSILLSLICIIGLILIVILLIAPELTQTVTKLVNETIPNFFSNVEEWAINLSKKYPEIEKYLNEYELDWDKISGNVLNLTQYLANGVFNSTFSIIGTIVNTITNFVIGLVFAVYLLSNKEKLAVQGKKILYGYLPMKRADRILSILKLTNTSFSNFLSGQCVEAVIEGCLFFIVLSLFGFNYAMLIGVIAAFMALIPIFGAFIAALIGFLLLFMVDPVQALWFILIFIIIQQVESNLIYPYVVGGSIGLPSIWVLFALTVGGSLMGVVGMIIVIPLFSVFYILLREAVQVRLTIRRVPSEKYEKEFTVDLEQQRLELEQRGRNRELRRKAEREELMDTTSKAEVIASELSNSKKEEKSSKLGTLERVSKADKDSKTEIKNSTKTRNKK